MARLALGQNFKSHTNPIKQGQQMGGETVICHASAGVGAL